MAQRSDNPAADDLNRQLKRRARKRRTSLGKAHEAQRRTSDTPVRNDLLPELEFTSRRLDELSLPDRAIRKLDPAHITEVAASIQTLGFCHPILINIRGRILDGATRYAAARQLCLTAIPCVVLRHLTPATERVARIAMNRLQERGSWDIDQLRLEFEELIELDAPIEIMGFEEAELDILLADDDPDPDDDGEPAPVPGDVATSEQGDGWQLGEHRVLCGDARNPDDYAELMAGEHARVVITDPPYNVLIGGHVSGLGKHTHREFIVGSGELSADEFLQLLTSFIIAARFWVLDGGLIAAFMDWRGIGTLLAAGSAAELELINMPVWSKTNAGMGSLWRSAYELLAVFKVGQASHVNNVELGRHGRWRSNVWTYPGGSSLGSDARDELANHPTPKPVALLEDAIYDVTNRDEIVLDPFLGSGSCIIAAEKAGRRCYGMELDPGYVDVILRRWIVFTGQQPILASTGETFEQVQERRWRERYSGEAGSVLALPYHGEPK